MFNDELYIEQKRPERNPTNGRFLKGMTPHNKGKKWEEWMDGRKRRRVLRIGLKNLSKGREDFGGWNARPIFALDDEGNTIAWFASAMDAERKTGISASNISRALRKGKWHAGGYLWIFDVRKQTKK